VGGNRLHPPSNHTPTLCIPIYIYILYMYKSSINNKIRRLANRYCFSADKCQSIIIRFNSMTNRNRLTDAFFNHLPRVTLAAAVVSVCIIICLLLLSRYYTILVRLIVRVEFNPKLIHRLWRAWRRGDSLHYTACYSSAYFTNFVN